MTTTVTSTKNKLYTISKEMTTNNVAHDRPDFEGPHISAKVPRFYSTMLLHTQVCVCDVYLSLGQITSYVLYCCLIVLCFYTPERCFLQFRCLLDLQWQSRTIVGSSLSAHACACDVPVCGMAFR